MNRITGNYSPHDTGIRLAAIKRSKAASYRLSVELLQPNTPERVAVYGRWDQHAPTALVQLDPRSEGYAFLRIEWNPRRWAAWQLPSLLGRINDLLLKPSDLGAMFRGASVTRADIAVDLTVRGDRYYWSRNKTTKRRPWGNEATGQVETLYLGTGKAKNAHGAVKVYAADLLHDDLPEGDVTRLECTVRSGKNLILVADLPDLANPLMAVGCLDVVRAAKAAKVPSMWPDCLLDKSVLRGIAHTQQWLHSQSPDMAVRFAKSIKSATPPFWTPGAFWKLWPSVLQQALPWMFEANSYTTNMQAA